MYTTLAEAKELAGAVAKGVGTDSVVVGVFPPFPWLTAVAEVLRGTHVGVGAQDCSAEKEGAFTGQVSAPMLLEAGCRYAIIGHSERRHGLHETDDLLNRKIKAVLSSGLVGIFCIGELLAERESNRTESVLRRQLTAGLAGLDESQVARLAIAYEPVWAIGTGKVATDQQAQQAHAFVRTVTAELFGRAAADAMPIAYGGSVKPDNVTGLMAQPDVDGALVGGASLKADSFLEIIKAAAG